MKIDSTEQNTIIVELSGSDLKELEITYDEMDYSNIETRRVIWTLLDRARHTLGRDIDPSGKLEIEVLPDGSDGCVVLFTVSPRGVMRFEKGVHPLVFETSDINSLIDCARQLKISQSISSSELYTLSGAYRLIIGLKRGHTVPPQISEFLSRVDGSPEDETREHWRCLSESDAVICLCGKLT